MHLGTWDDPKILIDRNTGKMVFLWIHAGIFYYKTGASNERPANPTDGIVLPDAAAVAALIAAHAALPNVHHAKQHALDSTLDHTIGGLTNTYLVKSDGTKIVPATNTDAAVAAAVAASHARAHAMDDATDHTGTNLKVDTIQEKTGSAGVLNKDTKGIGGAAGNAILFADKFADINAAWSALPANGGTIYVSAGTSIPLNSAVASIEVNKSVVIFGCDAMCGTSEAGFTGKSIITLPGAPAAVTRAFTWTNYNWRNCSLTLRGITFSPDTAASNWCLTIGDGLNLACYDVNIINYKMRRAISSSYYTPKIVLHNCRFEVWEYGVVLGSNNYTSCIYDIDTVSVAFTGTPGVSSGGFYIFDPMYQGITIRNCEVYNAGSSAYGFMGRMGYVTFENCRAFSCRGWGFYAYQTGATTPQDFVIFKNCVAISCAKHGFYAAGTDAAKVALVTFDGCYAKDCGTLGAGYSGFRINSYVTCWIRHCRAYSAGTYHDNGIHFSSATGTTIREFTDCDFDNGHKTVGGVAVRWANAALKAAARMDCIYEDEAFDA